MTKPLDPGIFARFDLRLTALAVDFVFLLAMTFAIVTAVQQSNSPALIFGAWVASIVLPIAYYVTAHARFGRTLGKACVGLRVTRVTGEPVGWVRATVRESPWILVSCVELLALDRRDVEIGSRLLDWIPMSTFETFASLAFARLVLGLSSAILVLGHPRHRALHDLLARTVVVRDVHAAPSPDPAPQDAPSSARP